MKTKLPKIIWFLWFQGLENAPYIVRKCFASWQRHNPEWEVIFLQESNLEQYAKIEHIVELNSQYILNQAKSDIIRINILNRHGGVWVDATCFCCKPLDEWLNNYLGSDFFAFDSPGIDRPISSWFMASCQNSQLTSRFCDRVNSYWLENHFTNQNNLVGKIARATLGQFMSQISYQSRNFELAYRLMKAVRVYPYFWFHYTFAVMIRNDPLGDRDWKSTKKYSADIPHRLDRHGFFQPLTEQIKQSIDSQADPLYKLTWKYSEDEYVKDSVLYYLLERYT